MADIPVFPDETNVERFRDFMNLQKEMSEHLLTQKKLYEQIGRINFNLEQKIVKRRQSEWRMMNDNLYLNNKYNILIKDRAIVKGQEAKALEERLASIVQEIKYNRELITLSRDASAIEIEMAKKRYDEDHKWAKFASTQLRNLIGLKVDEYDLTKSIGDELLKLDVKGEMIAYTWGAILMMLKGAYDLFNKMDKSAWEFRKAMGMTRGESAIIRRDAQRIAIDYMNIGVTVEGVYKSYQALGKAVGGVHNVTKSMAEDVSIMAAQLGISEETSARFLRNMAVISKSSMESQTNMMYMAQDMSSAAGVQLSEVMSDVAAKSTKTLLLMSRLPNVVLRSAIELRRMGTSMDMAANAGSQVLDFTQNINAEMEASVLLGRSINMQRIRQLTYARDLVGAAKATVDLARKHGFATKMDYFQMQAFAQMTGYNVDQLLNMVQTTEQLERIRRSGTPEQKAQLALYEKMTKENEAAAKARAKDSSALLRTMNNQARLTAISAKWNQILARAQEWLLPAVDYILAMVIPAMDIARGLFAWTLAFKVMVPIMGKIAGFFNAAILSFQSVNKLWGYTATLMDKILYPIGKIAWYIGEWSTQGKKAFMSLSWVAKIRSWFSPLSTLGKVFETIGGWFGKIGGWLGRVFAPIGKLLGFAGKFGGFLGMFGKYIPVIGWVISAFQFIGKLVGLISDYFKNWSNMSVGQRIIQGLLIIPKALWGVLVQPFIDAFKYIWRFFGGNSPSLLGMGILNGIVAIGTLLFKAIFMPWYLAFKAITMLVPIVGRMIMSGFKQYLNFGAYVVKGFALIGTHIFGFIRAPFLAAFKWIIDKFAGIGRFIGKFFDFGKYIIGGMASIGTHVFRFLTTSFQAAFKWIIDKFADVGKFVGRLFDFGKYIANSLASIGTHIFRFIIVPFNAAFKWIIDKFSGVGRFIGRLFGREKSVEKKVTAAYIPAVTVTPKGTEIAKPKAKDVEAKKIDEKGSDQMSDATGHKICSLLEKILAKDNNIKMDGQLLSVHLARTIESRGNYGVNK